MNFSKNSSDLVAPLFPKYEKGPAPKKDNQKRLVALVKIKPNREDFVKITLKRLSRNKKNTMYASMIMMIPLVMMMVAPRFLRRERRDLSVGRSQTPSSQDLPMLIIRMIVMIITIRTIITCAPLGTT